MKLYDSLKVAPYQVDDQSAGGDDDDEFSAARGLRVLAVAYSTERFALLCDAFLPSITPPTTGLPCSL